MVPRTRGFIRAWRTLENPIIGPRPPYKLKDGDDGKSDKLRGVTELRRD